MISVDLSSLNPALNKDYFAKYEPALADARKKLSDGSGAGGEYTGWVDLPVDYDKGEFARICQAAEKIKRDSKALVVIGIGGSYLGARAVIELVQSQNYNLMQKATPDVYFAGNSLSP
ncbi:MAG: glucose-6-phosphate isomerase, partial [Oscillospiraceae bacterium]